MSFSFESETLLMHLEDMSCPDSENSLLLTVEEVSPPTLLINTPLTGFKVKKWLTIRILIISINLVMIHLPNFTALNIMPFTVFIYLGRWNLKVPYQNPEAFLWLQMQLCSFLQLFCALKDWVLWLIRTDEGNCHTAYLGNRKLCISKNHRVEPIGY